MHPILGHPRRLLTYTLAWIPAEALLITLLAVGAGMGYRRALALAAPLGVIYGIALLAVWYTCRALPLQRDAQAAAGTHLVAAIVVSGLWMLVAQGIATSFWPGMPTHAMRTVVYATGILLYGLAVAGYYLALSAQQANEAELRASEARTLAREAELRALKAQINPHFLFNSLNSISALTSADAARAREMCILLGDFLRRTLALGGAGEHTTVALAEELALVRAFLAIEQVRFGERLKLIEDIAPAALQAPVPPLLLQPLVENAVVHGIAHLVEGGNIQLHASREGEQCRVAVANPYDPDAPRQPRSGLGLANVKDRLRARFGTGSRCEVLAHDGLFTVTLSWSEL